MQSNWTILLTNMRIILPGDGMFSSAAIGEKATVEEQDRKLHSSNVPGYEGKV